MTSPPYTGGDRPWETSKSSKIFFPVCFEEAESKNKGFLQCVWPHSFPTLPPIFKFLVDICIRQNSPVGMSRSVLPKHVISVIKYQKDPLKALEMFNSVKKEDGFKHNLQTFKAMVEKLGHHGEFDAMEQTLEEMRANVDNSSMEGAYICAVKSYGRKGKIQEAVNVFERMDFYNCEPSVLSYNVIMNVLVEYGYFKQAHKVYMRMLDRKLEPDVYSFTIRIKSFCCTKRPDVALRLLRNMHIQGCDVNPVTYCTVITGFYECDRNLEGFELFEEMVRLRMIPDVITFNKLISTLCKKGKVRESERLLNKVLKRGVFPNVFTFNIFIQGLCKNGLLADAGSSLDQVSKEGLVPDVVTQNTLQNRSQPKTLFITDHNPKHSPNGTQLHKPCLSL